MRTAAPVLALALLGMSEALLSPATRPTARARGLMAQEGGGSACPNYPKCSGAWRNKGCDGQGQVMGGMATIPGFGWWPIKVFRPCPAMLEAGYQYRRRGQTLNEIIFQVKPTSQVVPQVEVPNVFGEAAEKPSVVPREGERAPDFSVVNQKDEPVSLSSLPGRTLLWFYPRDCSSSCTLEGERFRDLHDALKGEGVAVVGVSPDGAESHREFINELGLPFDLLADTTKRMISAFGAVKADDPEKVQRSSFLISESGVVEKVWLPVTNAKEHPDEVLAYVRGE